MATGPATVSTAAQGGEAMWLNITAAKVICAMCIGIGFWLVHQTDPRDVVVRSAIEPVEPDRLLTVGRDDHPTELPLGGSREHLVRQFDRLNAMDRELELSRATREERPSAPVATAAAVDLPPLLLPQPGAVAALAAAEPTEDVADVAVAGPAADVALSEDNVIVPPPDDAIAVVLTAAPPAPMAGSTAHRVAKGERLVQIAARYYGSRDQAHVDALLQSNPAVKARGGRLLAGETLRIPALGETARDGSAALVVAASDAVNVDMTLATAAPRWYTIQAKDSLSGIAQRFLSDSKRWPEIVKLNRKLDPNKIVPGMRIKLPPAIGVVSR